MLLAVIANDPIAAISVDQQTVVVIFGVGNQPRQYQLRRIGDYDPGVDRVKDLSTVAQVNFVGHRVTLYIMDS